MRLAAVPVHLCIHFRGCSSPQLEQRSPDGILDVAKSVSTCSLGFKETWGKEWCSFGLDMGGVADRDDITDFVNQSFREKIVLVLLCRVEA